MTKCSLVHVWMEKILASCLFGLSKTLKFIKKITKSLKTLCFYMVFDHPRTLFFDRDGPSGNKILSTDPQWTATYSFFT